LIQGLRESFSLQRFSSIFKDPLAGARAVLNRDSPPRLLRAIPFASLAVLLQHFSIQGCTAETVQNASSPIKIQQQQKHCLSIVTKFLTVQAGQNGT